LRPGYTSIALDTVIEKHQQRRGKKAGRIAPKKDKVRSGERFKREGGEVWEKKG